jgi:ATP-dependent Zn protease
MLSPRRELMDQLVTLLIEQETLEGEAFRDLVASYEATGKANVEAAQVGL